MEKVSSLFDIAIGSQLRTIRKSKKMSMDVVAEKLHCTKQMMSLYELGKTPLKAIDFKYLCQLYGTTMDSVVNDALKNVDAKQLEL